MGLAYKDSGYATVPVAQQWEEGLRMKRQDGVYVPAGTDVAGSGTVFDSPFDCDGATIALFNKPGTQVMVASEAIPTGRRVYAAANGKVSQLPVAAGTYILIGEAFSAAAEDGDAIEVAPVGTGIEVTVA